MEQAIHTVQWCGESTVLRLIYYHFNYFIWDTLFCPYVGPYLPGLAVVLYLSVAEAKPGLGDRGRSPWPDSIFLAAKVRWAVHRLSPEANITARMIVTHGSLPDSNNSDAKDWGRQRKQKFQFSFAICMPASNTAGIRHKQQCCFCNTIMRTFLSIRILP